MHFKQLAAAGAFALAAATALPAAAQTCSAFTDVPAGVFCDYTAWMKNRQITLGCGDGTTYCPDVDVTRLAMAAFMKRLGDALTPAFQRKRDNALGALNISGTGQKGLCPTDAVAITGYPRTAIVRGVVNLYTPDGGMDVEARVVFSTDGGTTWSEVSTGDGFAYGALYAGLTPPNDVTLHPMNVIDLAVGTSYRFGLAAVRKAGTGAIANVYCENLVQLINRNGTSAPFDAADDGRAPGRGD